MERMKGKHRYQNFHLLRNLYCCSLTKKYILCTHTKGHVCPDLELIFNIFLFFAITEMYFAAHYVLIHQWGGLLGANRGYPGEKLNSKAVGGQLVWVDLELRGRLNGKINAAR